MILFNSKMITVYIFFVMITKINIKSWMILLNLLIIFDIIVIYRNMSDIISWLFFVPVRPRLALLSDSHSPTGDLVLSWQQSFLPEDKLINGYTFIHVDGLSHVIFLQKVQKRNINFFNFFNYYPRNFCWEKNKLIHWSL